jgi:hypothetical protein
VDTFLFCTVFKLERLAVGCMALVMHPKPFLGPPFRSRIDFFTSTVNGCLRLSKGRVRIGGNCPIWFSTSANWLRQKSWGATNSSFSLTILMLKQPFGRACLCHLVSLNWSYSSNVSHVNKTLSFTWYTIVGNG